MSYRYLDHGADIGLEVESNSLEGLFAEAGRAIFSVMADLDSVGGRQSVNISLQGDDLDDLLYRWLSELVSRSNLQGQIYVRFPDLEIEESDSGLSLKAKARGERINPQVHELGTEVKAVTYQGLEIEREEEGWRCKFVVDV